jgi:hypothetical protein
VRRELIPCADPGGAGQAAHQFPQVALAEPPAGGGGQQRPAQLPPLPRASPLRPGGQVGIQGRYRCRGERDLSPSARPCGPRAAPGAHGPLPGRRCRRRRPHRRAGRYAAAAAPRPQCAAPGRRAGVGGGDQGAGLVPVQAHRGRVVRIHHRPGHALDGNPADQVMGRAVPVNNDSARRRRTLNSAARHRAGWRPIGPHAPARPPARRSPLGEPAEPGHCIPGASAAGSRPSQPGRPHRHQDLPPAPPALRPPAASPAPAAATRPPPPPGPRRARLSGHVRVPVRAHLALPGW